MRTGGVGVGSLKSGLLVVRSGVATWASPCVGPLGWVGGGTRGFWLTKVKKTTFQKTLASPVPTGQGSVLHRINFLGHETGHLEGSQKTCGRGFRAFCSKRVGAHGCPMEIWKWPDPLKYQGHINLSIYRWSKFATKLSGERTLADWVGSDEARLDEQMQDVTFSSAETQKGGLVRPWLLLDLVHFRYMISQNGNTLMMNVFYELLMIQ